MRVFKTILLEPSRPLRTKTRGFEATEFLNAGRVWGRLWRHCLTAPRDYNHLVAYSLRCSEDSHGMFPFIVLIYRDLYPIQGIVAINMQNASFKNPFSAGNRSCATHAACRPLAHLCRVKEAVMVQPTLLRVQTGCRRLLLL